MEKEARGKCLYIVLPCYNEEDVVYDSAMKLKSAMNDFLCMGIVDNKSKVLFVDDGSKDSTWQEIKRLCREDGLFEGIRLANNRGHQIALMAGMNAVTTADMVITMDVDLQQDIGAIPQFITEYNRGADIVYGIRNSRDTDGYFKRVTATVYYRLMKTLGCKLIEQSADYRLLSSKALDALKDYEENNLFLRGIVTELGFQTGTVYFNVNPRRIGKSKYTLKKMLKLAMDGITSFSIKPIRMVSILGGAVCVGSFLMILYAMIQFFKGTPVAGWASMTVSIWFLGGIQLLALGIIGEYVGRTYMESKKRPRYFILEETMKKEKEERTNVN